MSKKILIISPHTDDGELGCGGSIAKFIEEGNDVQYVALSCCEKSIPPEYPSDILSREVKAVPRSLEYQARSYSVLTSGSSRNSVRKFSIPSSG